MVFGIILHIQHIFVLSFQKMFNILLVPKKSSGIFQLKGGNCHTLKQQGHCLFLAVHMQFVEVFVFVVTTVQQLCWLG